MINYWIAVASGEHVRRGKEDGFMQVCHGKSAPLKRLRAGDGVAYYSPTITFGRKDCLQAFTAIGEVKDDEVYQVNMGNGFHPFRRNVTWEKAREAAIRPLLPCLDFTRNSGNWGYRFRFGLFLIGAHDFQTIRTAMRPDT